jgi:hypothetical protein
MSYLERYLHGEYKPVWTELMALGTIEDPEILKDAEAVATETMERVQINVERIIERLKNLNYEFTYPSEIYFPPSPDIDQKIQELSRLAGSIPMSLRFFYRMIGSINLTGTHKSFFPEDYPEPLVIESFPYFLDFSFPEWRERMKELPVKEQKKFRMELSPDYPQKTSGKGGLPYSIELPNPAVDAPYLEEWHKTTFIDYLRIAFQWGGFPGLKKSTFPPKEFLNAMTVDLAPL